MIKIMLALIFTTMVTQDPVEPIRAKISKAESAFTTDLTKIHNDLSKWLDNREKEARKKGDTNSINVIKESRKMLGSGITPKNIPLHLSKRIETITEMLDASYSSAIKEALMANLDDLANSLEDKRTEIKQEKENKDIFKLVAKIVKNHVQNGGFEDQIVTDKSIPFAQLQEWSSGNGDIIKNWTKEPWPDGNQCLQLSESEIKRTITELEPGTKYVLSYYVSTYTTINAPQKWGTFTLKSSIAGETISTVVKAPGSLTKYFNPGTDFPWILVTKIFEPKETEEVLTFKASGDPFVLIDNIRITKLIE